MEVVMSSGAVTGVVIIVLAGLAMIVTIMSVRRRTSGR